METTPKNDTKGKAALIIAAMSPKDSKSEAPSEEADEYQAAKEDAAGSMMSAMKSNDSKAFAVALEDFLSMCGE